MRKSFGMACAASAVAVLVGWSAIGGLSGVRDTHAQQFTGQQFYGQPTQQQFYGQPGAQQFQPGAQQFYGQPTQQQFHGPQYTPFQQQGQTGMAQQPFQAPGSYQQMHPGMAQVHPTIQLQQASQYLRESIQSLAQLQPSDARERAVDAANRALLEAQQAVVAASRFAPPPPADVTVFGPGPQQFYSQPDYGYGATMPTGQYWGTGGQQYGQTGGQQFGQTAAPQQWQTQQSGVQQQATVQLQHTAAQIRNSIQTLAQQPPRPEVERALELAHSALRDINQALVTVAAVAPPPPMDVTVYGQQQQFYR